MKEKTFIKNIKIEHLFGDIFIDWAIPENQSTTILVGDNGVGKTTILQLIRDIMTGSDFVQRNLYRSFKVWTNKDYYSLSWPLVNYLEALNFATQIERKEFEDTVTNSEQIEILQASIKKTLEEIERIRDSFKEMKNNGEINEFRSTGDDLEFLDIADRVQNINLKSNPRMSITYISTIDLLANLSREFKDSSGIKTNYFDEEVKRAFELFIHSQKNEKSRMDLERVFNNFFGDISKKVVISDDTIEFYNRKGKQLTLQDLSAGERQITYILINVALAAAQKHDLILMDEPEISLHLNWQSKLLEEIRKINDYSQIIVATHSPALVMKGWRDSYVDIREISSNND